MKKGSIIGAVMKKAASAVIQLMLFIISIISQPACFTNANPDSRPWALNPIITVFSPVENQSCNSSEVTLNFTVTKPKDWFESCVQMRYFAYCVDGFIDGVADEKETIVEVQDPLDAEDPTTSFSFSFNLTGLKDGPHWLEIYAEGFVSGSRIGATKRINFTTHTPEAESQLDSFLTSFAIGSIIIVAVVSVGLLLYFKKRKH